MSLHDFIYMFISSVAALFPVMNPISSGLIVNGFLEGVDDSQRKSFIKRIIVNCLLVGIGSLVVGHLILLLFGLAVPVIQLGGGIVICKAGLEWLSDTPITKTEKVQDTVSRINIEDVESRLFSPISFPISLGPGSISVIFTLMASASVKGNLLNTSINYLMISLAIVVLLFILYLFLSQGTKLIKKLGASGNMIINKMVAFITFCIGIQIIVTGIARIFHLEIL
ncbi:MarC family protein [Parabacteroides sp. PF5-9]|uniref:MarC family protein n=1 Tax=Parabacteroides sp. PF5-9 TaxID=1742404 RepID=UPI0024762EE5|nr:MarC family protein [Parabacteroides sp. PF5-9]MDH6359086.1 multiple antibiotic resistance protein [Parabacteroides sp. PF5-9]